MLSYIKIMIFLILLVPVCLGCSGCTSTQSLSDERPTLVLPESPEIKMRPVQWEIKNSMICLSPEQYSNLSLNTDDIKNFIIIQNKIIKIYKEYYNNINNKDSKQFLKEDIR